VALSKRERIIGFTTAGVLALLVLDRFVISPLMEQRGDLESQLVAAEAERDHANQLFAGAPHMDRRWRDMIAAGLTSNVTDAQSQASRALNEWAREARLTLSTLQPDPVEHSSKQKDFQQVPMRLIGTGSMRSISKFLLSLQTSKIPMRVVTLDLGNHGGKEGIDDLALTLTVSTLCLAPPAPANANANRGGAPAAGNSAQGVQR